MRTQPRDLAALYRSVATLLRAGMSNVQTASALTPASFGSAASVAEAFVEGLRSQRGLASVARHAGLPPHHVALLASGETVGGVDVACDALARSCEERAAWTRRIRRALARPLLLVTLLGLLGPAPLAFTQGAVAYLTVALAVLAFPLTVMVVATSPPAALLAAARSWPVVGPLLRAVAQARFCRNMSLLSGAGLPLLHTVVAAGEAADATLAAAAIRARRDLERGDSLSSALGRHGILDPLALSFASEGERTGRFDNAFAKAAELLESDVTARVSVLTRLLAVVALVVVGVGIGWFVIARLGDVVGAVTAE